MKKVGKFDSEVLDVICCPLKGPNFLLPIRHWFSFRTDGTAHHGAQQGMQLPALEFPASALATMLAGTYTLGVTPGTVTTLNAKPKE
ncbi:hypothetical protein AVEN_260780-1 [Araneus ventricosus]|uniref:Uncharacterized protein n=1 Tax=Araneus ventricosus TaxID=182803 RepID=A0A4Y2X684_ARAVE|nr:hypothetical protein AVEN_98692-1 [Araneus ventricosus]GBO45258.1 hypothetical protein AVEN_260780-1 [Araneus ventricosus]